jgi:hypothetical protein
LDPADDRPAQQLNFAFGQLDPSIAAYAELAAVAQSHLHSSWSIGAQQSGGLQR